MGRGDIKTKKGKRFSGSFGISRKRKKAVAVVAPKKKVAKKSAPAKKVAVAKAAPKAVEVSTDKLSEAALKKMTVKDLKNLAAKNNIELPAKALKGDLVKALLA